jgi:hypothetical protein
MKSKYLLAMTLMVAACSAGPAPTPATKPATSQPATQPARTKADYEAHAKKVREFLPKNFTTIIEPPFIVTGNGTPDSVQSAATNTVKWAVEHLKKDYFQNDPKDIITVYLFKDKPSYDKYTDELFNDNPGTPYGYYSPTHKALIMNIATGGGTLVHEIVHPYIATNFPNCPPWFNEGLGSLYEQSAEKNGHIIGLTNWRLAGLQRAINGDKLPPFKDLFAMDQEAFYTKDKGNNYAQARYLLYYLQEKNLLHDYYKRFTKDQKTDPTGLESLKKTLKEDDLDAFQKRWQKWVLTLRFGDAD